MPPGYSTIPSLAKGVLLVLCIVCLFLFIYIFFTVDSVLLLCSHNSHFKRRLLVGNTFRYLNISLAYLDLFIPAIPDGEVLMSGDQESIELCRVFVY